MERRTPGWVWAVLAFLAVAAAAERCSPAAPDRSVLEAARSLEVELDPRRMSARELRQLPGVGETLALAIARSRDAHRGSAPLAWEDVPGIGETRSREIRAWLRERGVDPDPLSGGVGGVGTGAEAPGRYPDAMNATGALLGTIALALVSSCNGSQPVSAPEPEGAVDSGGSGIVPLPESEEGAAPPEEGAPAQPLELEIDGARVHALASGEEGAPCVLLLHGARYSASTWQELGTLERLAAAGYRSIALDLPGYGASEASERAPGEFLAAMLDALGIQRAVIVAPSMSGAFAFALLREAPGRVAGFVPIAPAGAQDFAPPEGLRTPALVLWGEKDEVMPAAGAAALGARLPGSRVEILAGAAHACYLDEPGRFHELLLGFLAELRARGRW